MGVRKWFASHVLGVDVKGKKKSSSGKHRSHRHYHDDDDDDSDESDHRHKSHHKHKSHKSHSSKHKQSQPVSIMEFLEGKRQHKESSKSKHRRRDSSSDSDDSGYSDAPIKSSSVNPSANDSWTLNGPSKANAIFASAAGDTDAATASTCTILRRRSSSRNAARATLSTTTLITSKLRLPSTTAQITGIAVSVRNSTRTPKHDDTIF
ncbi:hypothetical protein B0T19DRAFT_439239 [Cercophora scortea]|uniref:Uncharacterized protein n=1 Tax=Cercophora scortea TaxID=314031 RepID=A0AAE0IW63_9PEZI|nr:hypothetical protein B0T19DRAFT_439239 [Cercophora scortea]